MEKNPPIINQCCWFSIKEKTEVVSSCQCQACQHVVCVFVALHSHTKKIVNGGIHSYLEIERPLC